VCSGLLCGGCGLFESFGGLSVHRVFLWCFWDSLGIEFASGVFVVFLGQFGGMSVHRVALWLVRDSMEE